MTTEEKGNTITIKILKAEKRYGLKRGQMLAVQVVERKSRTTVFFEPPMKYIELYNEDWEQM